ncbi:N-acetylmuramoyl-L-alanine amidase family protein [Brevibacillus ginsengisoli]|uniref:N-acetylmuramoyl-L-alanine amidase family protein n=1 Tax=Brevibacillus ginsengisoli TaxID=363854 RepID=UPI003CEF7473
MKQKVMGFCLMIGLLLPVSTVQASPSDYPIDVLIDVGHGGVDSGTTYGNILEKDINMAIGKQLYQALAEKGYHVVMNRDGDYALSDENHWSKSRSRHLKDLAQRRHLAMELQPQILVSLHVNWSNSSRASGPLVLYQHNSQSYMLAELMQNSLNLLYKVHGKPQVGKTYYLLRHSICPSIIVEMGYLSNVSDRHRLLTPREQAQIAASIRAAVDEYFMLLGELRQEPTKNTWITHMLKHLMEKLH